MTRPARPGPLRCARRRSSATWRRRQLRRLIDDGALEAFADGEELIHADARTSAVFLLVEGACDVQRKDGTVRLAAPALVGEIAALTGAPRTATVRAAGPVKAIVIERDRFLEAIRTSPAAGQALTELVADRLCAPDSLRQVGRFTIDGIIGRGGSGRVLRARHPLLEIPIALKMLSHALALLPDGPNTFVREASLLVRLDHPGIVRVLDAFEAHGTFFIVMPWLDGATLRALIDRDATFTREQVLRIAEESLDALIALHEASLVHRDIKPSNIQLKTSGRVVLIDFGIASATTGEESDSGSAAARASGGGAPRAAKEDDARQKRQFVGSPHYSSPEQILGRPVDGRSDVYSLGCTLYELVFGQPPFPGDGIEAVIDGHLHGTAAFDLTTSVAMGEAFTGWLKKCLSRTRSQRPDAAAALAGLRSLRSANA